MHSHYGDNRNYGNAVYYVNYQGPYDNYNYPHTHQNINQYPQGGNQNNINRAEYTANYHHQNKQNPYLKNNQGQGQLRNTLTKKMNENEYNKLIKHKNPNLNNNDNNVIQNDPLYYDIHQNIQDKIYYEYDNYSDKNQNKNEIKRNGENLTQKKATTQVGIRNNNDFPLKPEEIGKKNKTQIEQTPTDKNKDSSNNNNIPPINPINLPTQNPFKLPSTYYFHSIGLYNIGSTCYMNAPLQCLLHVSPLVSYFIHVYNQQNSNLKKLNESAPTKGKISDAFFEVLKLISKEANNKSSNTYLNPQTTIYQNYIKPMKAVSPEIFQKTVGKYNPQFQNLEANDSKDLILYLFQAMHQELNYWTKNKAFTGYPDQYDRNKSYQAFMWSYDVVNFSIISDLFYGTNETTTKCQNCQKYIYNFQKFEFMIFGVSFYDKKEFNIYNGFDDYTKIDKLTGDNQYYCNNCKKLCDAEMFTKILIPPKHLLINIDYGKNKKFMPKSVKYGDTIDITKYMSFDYGKPIKYKILGICSHLGISGSSGHYIAYCRNKQDGKWYQFNDSFVTQCKLEEINNGGNPYLLLYEKLD